MLIIIKINSSIKWGSVNKITVCSSWVIDIKIKILRETDLSLDRQSALIMNEH